MIVASLITSTAMDAATTSRDKSALTRRRLLDAAEALVADEGYAAPSHRSIARRAGVHVALVNYHYGSKEMLLEAVVARRADQLIAAWKRALARRSTTTRRPRGRAARVLGAVRDAERARGRRVAQLPVRGGVAVAGAGRRRVVVAPVRRHRARVPRCARPRAAGRRARRDRARFRYARELLDDVLLRRCNKSSGRCNAPPGLRENDVDGLIRFLAAGLEALPRPIRRT
jgi:AcrR family transcriptional regulator